MNNSMQRVAVPRLFVVALLLLAARGGGLRPQQDRHLQQGVPTSEFEALKNIYDGTKGPAWEEKGGDAWFTTPTTCSWAGVTCAAGHVVQLSLSQFGLQGSLPDEFAAFPRLEVLSLSRNKLKGTIPTSLLLLPNLKKLYLWGNLFSDTLPTGASTLLPRLTTFDVSRNCLDLPKNTTAVCGTRTLATCKFDDQNGRECDTRNPMVAALEDTLSLLRLDTLEGMLILVVVALACCWLGVLLWCVVRCYKARKPEVEEGGSPRTLNVMPSPASTGDMPATPRDLGDTFPLSRNRGIISASRIRGGRVVRTPARTHVINWEERQERLQRGAQRWLFHRTSREAANSILKRGIFASGSRGAVGAGIYFAETPEATRRKARQQGVVLRARVLLGRQYILKHTQNDLTFHNLYDKGYDSVVLECFASGTEWVVYHSDQVRDIAEVADD